MAARASKNGEISQDGRSAQDGWRAQEGRRAQERSVDDWLPITSSRNAKWWYSAFHNVTAMVGAGVLSLPYAMSNLGWYVRSTSSFLRGKRQLY
jgi:hypothetical protein